MSLQDNSAHIRTYSASDRALFDSLLAKSLPTEPMSVLVELLSTLVANQELFDRLNRLSEEPLLSFAELCCQMPKIPPKDKGSASSSTVPACRRSARVAGKAAERERSRRPLDDFSTNRGIACTSQPKIERKRKRTPKPSYPVEDTREPQARSASLSRPTKKVRHAAGSAMSTQERKSDLAVLERERVE